GPRTRSYARRLPRRRRSSPVVLRASMDWRNGQSRPCDSPKVDRPRHLITVSQPGATKRLYVAVRSDAPALERTDAARSRRCTDRSLDDRLLLSLVSEAAANHTVLGVSRHGGDCVPALLLVRETLREMSIALTRWQPCPTLR